MNFNKFEDCISEATDIDVRPVHMALQVRLKSNQCQREVAIAVRLPRQRQSKDDAIEWELVTFSFLDNAHYSTLETILIQFQPRDCCVPQDVIEKKEGEYKKMANLFERHGVSPIKTKSSSFRAPLELESDLMKLIRADRSVMSPSLEDAVRSPLSCLMVHLELLSQPQGFSTYMLSSSRRDISAVMQLDGAALEALNILPTKSTSTSTGEKKTSDTPTTNASLFQVLNKGKTAMGKRVLDRWIRLPLLDVAKIKQRQDLVALFLEQAQVRMELLDEVLKFVPDLDKLAVLLQDRSTKVKLSDLVLIYDTVSTQLPSLVQILESVVTNVDHHSNDALSQYLSQLRQIQDDIVGYTQLMEEVVDFDARSTSGILVVNPKHDSELLRIRQETSRVESDISHAYDDAKDLLKDHTLSSEIKLERDTVRGYVLRVTKKKDESTLSKVKSIIICQVLANGVHFTTPSLKSAARTWKDLTTEYEERQTDLIRSAVEVAQTYVPVLEMMSMSIGELDVLLGFAHVAGVQEYCRPTIVEDSESHDIQIKEARHPCLELQDSVQFIPNDYAFDRSNSRFHLVSGPNMGGKSTYIRQLGMIAIMTQIGSYVPASSATMPVFDRVLVRVGAGDAQQRGVSTFMAEMLEASVILDRATPQSLVILDEIGRGTSTFDGYGLAYAISYHLLQITRAHCIFATHFHELTLALKEFEGVVNQHVTAAVIPSDSGEQQIVMSYAVKDGPCLESFGIHVAELTNFPSSVIAEAKRKAAELEHFEPENKDRATCVEVGQKELTQIHAQLHAFAQIPLDTITDPKDFQQHVLDVFSTTA